MLQSRDLGLRDGFFNATGAVVHSRLMAFALEVCERTDSGNNPDGSSDPGGALRGCTGGSCGASGGFRGGEPTR
jgi:hypothetical protein